MDCCYTCLFREGSLKRNKILVFPQSLANKVYCCPLFFKYSFLKCQQQPLVKSIKHLSPEALYEMVASSNKVNRIYIYRYMFRNSGTISETVCWTTAAKTFSGQQHCVRLCTTRCHRISSYLSISEEEC